MGSDEILRLLIAAFAIGAIGLAVAPALGITIGVSINALAQVFVTVFLIAVVGLLFREAANSV
jgi:hypothetical protein